MFWPPHLTACCTGKGRHHISQMSLHNPPISSSLLGWQPQQSIDYAICALGLRGSVLSPKLLVFCQENGGLGDRTEPLPGEPHQDRPPGVLMPQAASGARAPQASSTSILPHNSCSAFKSGPRTEYGIAAQSRGCTRLMLVGG